MYYPLYIWFQASLVITQLSNTAAKADAEPKAKGHADPWDWQKAYPVFQPYSKPKHELPHQPQFLPVDRDVSVQEGQTAKLPCRVKNLFQHYTVSWIRARDVTVLSVGHLTFSSDKRLSVLEELLPGESTSDWSLTIVNASSEDQGVYECQINTDPKMNKKFNLFVKEEPKDTQGDSPYYDMMAVDQHGSHLSQYEKTHSKLKKHKDLSNDMDGFNMWLHDNGCICPKPQVKKHKLQRDQPYKGPEMEIAGGSVQYVSEGSEVGLECSVSGLLEPPRKLHWERNAKALRMRDRAGLSIETERLVGESRTNLYLGQAELRDTGNYTCVSDITKPETVLLVVTREYDEEPVIGRMKRSRTSSKSSISSFSRLLLVVPLSLIGALPAYN